MAGLAEAKTAKEARRMVEYCILSDYGCCFDGVWMGFVW